MAVVAAGIAAGSIAAFTVPAAASAAAPAKPSISNVFENNLHAPSGGVGGGATVTVQDRTSSASTR
jgi:hypothetical protein